MRVVHLAAGAGAMYCGSCLHDNRLVAALRAQGRDVVLWPLYTPLRTDEADVSARRVRFGALNVYLQHALAVFRHTPPLVDRLLDARVLLGAVGRLAGSTRPERLGELTLSTLRGEDGPLRKEVRKLVAALRALQPDLVQLPNLMFVGVARSIRAALRVPVLCGLTGEDVFLDRLPEPHRGQVFAELRTRAADVDGFVALTDYYAGHAVRHFGLPADRIRQIPLGIRTADFAAAPTPTEPFTIGYLARICPEKGLAELCQAVTRLWHTGRACRLRVAGYLGATDRAYLARVRADFVTATAPAAFDCVGEVTRSQKAAFLRTLHVFSVPTVYPESKGFYILEALAAGVPVVQPAHGSFPELIAATGGGLLCPPGDVPALSNTLARLADDAALRAELAARGRAAVHARFTVERMAAQACQIYETFADRANRPRLTANAERLTVRPSPTSP